MHLYIYIHCCNTVYRKDEKEKEKKEEEEEEEKKHDIRPSARWREEREREAHTPAPLPRVAHLKEQPPKRLGLILYSVKMALRMLFSILVRERERERRTAGV